MKNILIACLVVSFLGSTVASPISFFPRFSDDRGNGNQQNVNLGDLLTSVLQQPSGGGNQQQSNDEVTALLESLISTPDNQGPHEPEPEPDEDLAAMQSLLRIMAQVEEEAVNGKGSAGAQFLRGLGRSLWTSGKKYLTDRYCQQTSKQSY